MEFKCPLSFFLPFFVVVVLQILSISYFIFDLNGLVSYRSGC